MGSEYIRNNGKYKQLSPEERGKIEAYLTLNYSISKIAKMMKRSKSTISEEIKKRKYNGRYTAKIAKDRSRKRRNESHRHSKWRNIKLLHFIEKRLKKEWSPEIISVEWKKNTGETFSHTSIYTIIKKHRPEWKKLLIYSVPIVRIRFNFKQCRFRFPLLNDKFPRS